MQYKEAFTKLGYDLKNHRQEWSAEKAEAVCLTLWKREIDWGNLVMDSRISAGDISIWGGKPGNKKRIAHAKTALDKLDGWIDAILVSGDPGVSYEQAFIWWPAERENRMWRITFLDDVTGHIRLEALPK